MSGIRADQLRPVGADGVHVFEELDWGYPHTLYRGVPEDLESTTADEFRAAVRLRSPNGGPVARDIVQASPDDMLAGDSNYVVPSAARVTRLAREGSPDITVTVHANEHGRAAALVWSTFRADGLQAAMIVVNAMLQRLALLYPTLTRVPLLWDAVLVERAGEPVTRAVTIHAGYPVVDLPGGFEFGGRSLGIIDYFGPHLVEGLRSISPFWRVICYYKVARFYYTGLRNKFKGLRHRYGLPKTAHRVLAASAPFDVIAADLVGKRYTEIVDTLRGEYRNVFAHFTTDEAMTPLNPQDEERAARASAVLKVIAFDALADARRDMSELATAGATEQEIYGAIAEVDAAERSAR